MLYRFGEFELDAARRTLRRDGCEVALPAKVFACMLYLVEHRDRAVGRDELMTAVWGHLHLTESVLGQAMRHARQALCDNGEKQDIIRTVRGFGYSWAAAVTVTAPPDTVDGDASADERAHAAPAHPAGAPAATPHRARGFAWATVAALVLAASGAWLLADRRGGSAPAPAATNLVALLPVEAGDDPDDAWIRLGAMDFVARRLRAAGESVVPSETVIALLGDAAEPFDEATRATVARATGAHIVLDAHAERVGDAWSFTLDGSAGGGRTVRGRSQAGDVIAAAREASDQVALMLGGAPPGDPKEEVNITQLLQRINAALRAQRLDAARELVANAPDSLRANPEVRLQVGRIAFYAHDLDAAQAAFDALLADVSGVDDAVMRARALNGLAAVLASRGERIRAEPLMQEAARLIEASGLQRAPDTLGTIWMNLGNVAQERGDLDEARTRMARARQVFESSGDVRNLAQLDGNLGVIETRREHLPEALRLFESAARRHAEVHDVGGELTALSYIVQVHLLLLDAPAAEPARARLLDLLQRSRNPELTGRARIALVDLAFASGRLADARLLGADLIATVAGHPDLDVVRVDAHMRQAEDAILRDDAAAALAASDAVLGQLAKDDGLLADDHARGWLVRVRARLLLHDPAGAAEAAAGLAAMPVPRTTPSVGIYATLARAEIAAAAGDASAARAAYDSALATAETSGVPLRVLQVVQSYAAWLLDAPDLDGSRLLRVVERVADAADRDYDSALVEVAAYHRLGPRSAWQAALDRALRLAGERHLPPALREPPGR